MKALRYIQGQLAKARLRVQTHASPNKMPLHPRNDEYGQAALRHWETMFDRRKAILERRKENRNA